MRVAAFLCAMAVLVCGASAVKYTQPAFPYAKPTGKSIVMNNTLFVQSAVKASAAIPGKLATGKFAVNRVGKATPKVELKTEDVGCLNTKVPPPLNWGPLYCAGREVKVFEWTDDVGSLHRTFDIPAQANVTSDMIFWLFSPVYPQYIEFGGKMWFWYHLWHPMDHIMGASMVAPSTLTPGAPGMYTLINEHYRNTPEERARNATDWTTDAWFHVDDTFSNFLKKRIIISISAGGVQTWTLIIQMKDTPEGVKLDNELIIGVAAAGHDSQDAGKGTSPQLAQLLNDNVVKPMIASYAPDAVYRHSVNAVSRHVIEEFSMFRFFLPTVFSRFPMFQTGMAMTEFFNRPLPRTNYGPFMWKPPGLGNTDGLIEALVPLNHTALANTTQKAEAAQKLPESVSKGSQENAKAKSGLFSRIFG